MIDPLTDQQPDWPPPQSAFLLDEGTRKYGSTGQLWQVRNRQWVRIKPLAVQDPPPGEPKASG